MRHLAIRYLQKLLLLVGVGAVGLILAIPLLLMTYSGYFSLAYLALLPTILMMLDDD
jgi:hypothetical protein